MCHQVQVLKYRNAGVVTRWTSLTAWNLSAGPGLSCGNIHPTGLGGLNLIYPRRQSRWIIFPRNSYVSLLCFGSAGGWVRVGVPACWPKGLSVKSRWGGKVTATKRWGVWWRRNFVGKDLGCRRSGVRHWLQTHFMILRKSLVLLRSWMTVEIVRF